MYTDEFNFQMGNLRHYCNLKVKIYPELAEQITELFELAQSEIEDGGSIDQETSLAYRDIDQIINDASADVSI